MKFFSLGPLWGEVRGEGGREINETVFARQISLHEPAGWWFSRSHYQRVGRWPCHPGEALETLFKFTQREAYGATFLFAETTSHLETGQPYRNDIALSYRIRSLPSRRGVKNSIRRRRLRDNFFYCSIGDESWQRSCLASKIAITRKTSQERLWGA